MKLKIKRTIQIGDRIISTEISYQPDTGDNHTKVLDTFNKILVLSRKVYENENLHSN